MSRESTVNPSAPLRVIFIVFGFGGCSISDLEHVVPALALSDADS
jgi:hypothetical protein